MDAFTIATIAYADIFDYPLTREELHRWMMFDGKPPKQQKQYYYLPGRTSLVAIRRRRELWQQEKWNIARRASGILSKISTIQLIGVTGGLAMNNAKREDDIDLFVVVSAGTLWTSRLLATLLMDIRGLRRHPKDRTVANKICLNMFVSSLSIPAGEQDLFSAHEVLQMELVFNRGNAYRRFLQANKWVKKFLLNAWRYKNKMRNAKCAMDTNVLTNIVHYALQVFELPSRAIQLWYMKKHRTNEVITDSMLRFHPKDARVWIKRKLAARLARYNVPLDKIFYAR